MDQPTRVFAARWIVPVSSPPINSGWLRIRGDEVIEAGQGNTPSESTDLGDVAILPGLINAHTHLEFSDCQKPIGQPGIPLHQWIGEVIAARAGVSDEERSSSIESGLRESRQAGSRMIGEITTAPCRYPASVETPELITFAEVLGLGPERAGERLNAAIEHNRRYEHGAWSSHAPYSTSMHTIESCIDLARNSQRPIAMHVAESPPERELLCSGTGPFAEVLHDLGVWQTGLFPWPDHPFAQLIEKLAAAPTALMIHGNDLQSDEIECLAARPNVAVVYCPRTHAFFQYPNHPVADMVRSGICVALGTDSRASNPDLSVWGEVQHLLNHRTDLDPQLVVRMATQNGADALGRADLGRLKPGTRPGLGCVHTAADDLDTLFEDFAKNHYEPFSGV